MKDLFRKKIALGKPLHGTAHQKRASGYTFNFKKVASGKRLHLHRTVNVFLANKNIIT